MKHMHLRSAQSGFSLIELSIVILVIGLLSAGVLLLTDNQGSQRCVEETSTEIAAIKQSINAYVASQGRLPRPALVTLGSSDSEFGKEVETLPNTDLVDTGSVLIGSLPHTTLGLATEFASDCWGNKFTYAVTKALTSNDPASGYKPSAGAIILRSGTRAAPQDLIDNAGYIIISHGADKVGATPLTFANITPRWCTLVDGAQIDRENCDATNDVFFDGLVNNGDVGDDHYDDVIAFEAKTATPACGTYGWGPQSYGQIGDGSLFQRDTPVPVATTERFTQVVTGSGHTCALNEAGAAFCWGNGNKGRLGNHNNPLSTFNVYTPTPVLGGLSFTKLSLSATHSCGLTAAGEAYCWGEEQQPIGTAASISGDTLIPAFSMVPTRVPTDIVFSDISTGSGYTCGVSTSGQAYCWGNMPFERFGHGGLVGTHHNVNYHQYPVPVFTGAGPQAFSQIFSGDSQTCGISNTGAAYCWGSSPTSSPAAIGGGLIFTSLSVGLLHVCGITNTQDAYCWGANGHSQLGNGGTAIGVEPVLVSGGHKWAIISAAENFTCAVTTTGQPYCWGLNSLGGSTPTAVSGGYVVSSLSSSMREGNTAFIACGTPPPLPCKLYSQPSGGDPASCCNGDVDGDGICGSPPMPAAQPCHSTFDLYHTEQADCGGAISTAIYCPAGQGSDAASYGSLSAPAHCGSTGNNLGGLTRDWAIMKCRPCSTLTPCRADGQPSGGNPANCCDGDNDGNGICGNQSCAADGASSGGDPDSCCNGDSDGNGTCGTQTSCTPAADGQPPANPCGCQNPDTDGNGTCGFQCIADTFSARGDANNCCNDDSDGDGYCGAPPPCSCQNSSECGGSGEALSRTSGQITCASGAWANWRVSGCSWVTCGTQPSCTPAADGQPPANPCGCQNPDTDGNGTCGTQSAPSAPSCIANGQPSGGNPSNCCNGDSDGNGTCGTQSAPPAPSCIADGQPSGGNPSNCCNDDSDGNGTCGTQSAPSAPSCIADGQPPSGGTCCNADDDGNGQCGSQASVCTGYYDPGATGPAQFNCTDCDYIGPEIALSFHNCDIPPCPSQPTPGQSGDAENGIIAKLNNAGKNPNDYHICVASGSGSCPSPGCDNWYTNNVEIGYAIQK